MAYTIIITIVVIYKVLSTIDAKVVSLTVRELLFNGIVYLCWWMSLGNKFLYDENMNNMNKGTQLCKLPDCCVPQVAIQMTMQLNLENMAEFSVLYIANRSRE